MDNQVGGLTGGLITNRTGPNQGIWQSARNAAFIFVGLSVVVGVPLGIATASAWQFITSAFPIVGIQMGICFGVGSGFATSLFYGGLAVIKHLILRIILWLDKKFPWRLVLFLDYATNCVFLRKVGGGYLFMHRKLQEYFISIRGA